MEGKIDPGPGYRLLEIGEIKPEVYEKYMGPDVDEGWQSGTAPGFPVGAHHCPFRVKITKEATVPNDSADVLRYGATKETTESPNWTARMEVSTDLPKDPKTKYHRPMYPVWNDTEVHTDANGHKYLNVDVYSVLAAFDPGHEVAHAVKKLLAAGTRDKGSKIQDYREAIISIEAAIYRTEIEGGAG